MAGAIIFAVIRRMPFGLWDERFCTIGHQEADYFLRALMYNKNSSSVNDEVHGRVLNPTSCVLIERPAKTEMFSVHHMESMQFKHLTGQMFRTKYAGIEPGNWSEELIKSPPKITAIQNYILYPYFEKDIEKLYEKNYLVP
jgi:hypothetical protein